jgi:hypothetical protein
MKVTDMLIIQKNQIGTTKQWNPIPNKGFACYFWHNVTKYQQFYWPQNTILSSLSSSHNVLLQIRPTETIAAVSQE